MLNVFWGFENFTAHHVNNVFRKHRKISCVYHYFDMDF